MSRDPAGGWGCQVLMGHRVSPGEAVGKRERRNLVLLTTVGAIAPPSINHRPMTGNSFGFSRVISSLRFELLARYSELPLIALPIP